MEQLVVENAALVAVDFQEGILRVPFVPHSANSVLANAVSLARSFRRIGSPVVLTRVAWAPDFADALKQAVDRPLPMPPGGLPADWADLSGDLDVAPDDIVITKRQWNAFHGTELDLQLRRRGIKTLVLAGIASNMGVESTARAAYELGYQLVFAEDAISSVAPGMHEFAAQTIFPMIGAVRRTEEIIAALG
ncbi:hydrolase [Paraburkholderia sp. GAS32]|uniref:hydrolase n=1 Tax=Paraburkholderia sp. GAS32 TaxID=3035129 RepID=UPI003D1907F2